MKGWLSLKIEIRLNVESVFFAFIFKILSEIDFNMKILCIFTTVKHQFKIVKNLRYNGNIISMQWQNGASAAKSGYKFGYDGQTALPLPFYGEGDGSGHGNGEMIKTKVGKDTIFNIRVSPHKACKKQ